MRELAVVIPCHNAAHCVGRQLAALVRQLAPDGWEVVIVDDGSEDDLSSQVRRYAHALPKMTVVTHAQRSGTGAARNTGARATAAARLLFLDADDEIDDGYLEAMAVALDEAPLVTARIDYTRLNPPEVLHRTPSDQVGDVLTPSLFMPHVLGGLMGMSRNLFELLGGFDEGLPALADIDISWRAQLLGNAIGVADTAVAVSLRATYRSRLRRSRFQGRDIVLLREKFAQHGVEPITWRSHLAGWGGLATAAWHLFRPAGRSELVWQFGWQLGVLDALLANLRQTRKKS
jgi:glycosyltransferase involved in cell wall biosynthesis